MKRRIHLAAAALLIILAGCSSIQVRTDFDPTAELTGNKTYLWLPPPEGQDTRVNNPLTEARIMGAIDRALGEKGYKKETSGTADFAVGYHAAVEGQLNIQQVNSYEGISWWHSYGPGRAVYTDTYIQRYDEGSLIVDILDYQTKHLVWRGSAQAKIDFTEEQEKRERLVNEAVDRMFKDFPPK